MEDLNSALREDDSELMSKTVTIESIVRSIVKEELNNALKSILNDQNFISSLSNQIHDIMLQPQTQELILKSIIQKLSNR